MSDAIVPYSGQVFVQFAQLVAREAFNAAADYYHEHREELHEYVRQGGERVRESFNRMMNHIMDEIQQPTRKRQREEIENESFDNSPGEDQAMNHHQDDANGGIEGAEEQLSKPRHVWRRFPNHQHAALKWVYSNFLTDRSSNVANATLNPFDQGGDIQTTTTLINSTGGAWTSLTGANIFGAGGAAGIATASGHDFSNPILFQIRMTTPYNIMKNVQGTGLVNSAIGYSQPAWLELFDTKYQFYHVNECEWELTLHFGLPWTNTTTPATVPYPQQMGYWIFWKYTSNDNPPTSYNISNSQIANINTGIGPGVQADGTRVQNVQNLGAGSFSLQCTNDDYLRMGGFHKKYVQLNNTHMTTTTIRGKYKFGQCKMDIKTQENNTQSASGNPLQTEGWMQTGSTYAFPEDLSIIIVQDNACNAGPNVYTPCGYRFETEHMIEFADLRSAFKFPTPANGYTSASTNLNTEAMFFNRGAAYS